MSARIDAIRSLLSPNGADAVLLTFLPDIRWAVGFSGSNALLLITADNAYFLSDGRYAVQAENEVQGATIHIPGYQLLEHIAENGWVTSGSTCLVQGDHLTIDQLSNLNEVLPEVALKPVSELLVKRVASKSEVEIDKIKAAQAVTDSVFSKLLEIVKPGISELDLAAEIVYLHMQGGCEKMAFEPIVASGSRSALPHARPTTAPIETGELLLIDMGGVKDGYASDMTRTIAVGAPRVEEKEVYRIVLDAQRAALEAARAGLTGKQLDAAARTAIANAGYSEAFSHSLGHGIGLQTHEWPRISSRSDDVLPAGAAITIEPGIYLEGKFGVRIEDLIILRDGGCTNLTKSPKDLLVL